VRKDWTALHPSIALAILSLLRGSGESALRQRRSSRIEITDGPPVRFGSGEIGLNRAI